MKPVEEQNHSSKVEGNKRINTSTEKLELKEMDQKESQSLDDGESKQMKEQSKRIRRPKSGKSL